MNDGSARPLRRLSEPFERGRVTSISAAPQRRQIVLVLGMHRSGTSLCSHVLSALGLDMADQIDLMESVELEISMLQEDIDKLDPEDAAGLRDRVRQRSRELSTCGSALESERATSACASLVGSPLCWPFMFFHASIV